MFPDAAARLPEPLRDYRYHVQRIRTAAGTDLPLLMKQHRLSWLIPVIKAYEQAEERAKADAGTDDPEAGRPEYWNEVSRAARIAAGNCKSGKNVRESHRAASHALWVIIRNADEAERAYRRKTGTG